jgi:AraC family transcriptional activator of pobA
MHSAPTLPPPSGLSDLQFTGNSKEYLQIATLTQENAQLLKEPIEGGLTIVWNAQESSCLQIDGVPYCLQPNELIFLTEFHQVETESISKARMIRFNRPFYCIINHDSEVGCRGILFFGASKVPIIRIPAEEEEKFEILWKMFSMEIQSKDTLQVEMLQMMLKRLLILCTRLYKEKNSILAFKPGSMDIVREFNFLVETHFKTRHTVSEYADMLNKSPKTLSNIFTRLNQKTPLQIIQDRVLLEARRQLGYTEKAVKEIAYETGFDDIQSFSRFFKNKEGVSPKEFRDNFKENRKQGKIANS